MHRARRVPVIVLLYAMVLDRHDLGVVREMRDDRMDVEVAGPAAVGNLLLGCELLVPEGEHVMLEEGPLDPLEIAWIEIGEIDSADFRAGVSGKGVDLEARGGVYGSSRPSDSRKSVFRG